MPGGMGGSWPESLQAELKDGDRQGMKDRQTLPFPDDGNLGKTQAGHPW